MILAKWLFKEEKKGTWNGKMGSKGGLFHLNVRLFNSTDFQIA